MANGKRVEAMRQQLAQTAAQMIQEQGIRDYRLAKEKAAARHGVDIRRGPLPRNTEIEAALAEYQRLFAGADAVGLLVELRRAALQAMRELEAFQPRLVGDVLSGLATPHSDVQLHVFADHSEAFDFHLQDRGIPFELVERRFRYGRGGYHHYPVFRFAAGGVGFEAVLFPLTELRQAPNSLVDGAPLARAKIEEVARLLADDVAGI